MSLTALLLLSATAGSESPTVKEFAKALADHTGGHVNATDLRRVSCNGFGTDEPTEAKCTWQQRVGSRWQWYSTYVAVDGRGWHLIDEPKALSR
jgi:hypothetical protein